VKLKFITIEFERNLIKISGKTKVFAIIINFFWWIPKSGHNNKSL